MLRFALKGIWARKWRLLATAVSIVMGVAFITATGLLSDTLDSAVSDLISSSLKGTDSVVRSTAKMGEGTGPQVTDRATIPGTLLDTVRATDGVRAAEGFVFAGVVALDPSGGRIGSSFGPPAILSNWVDDEPLMGQTLLQGAAPTGDGEAVIDVASAKDEGITIGQTISLILPASGSPAPVPYRVTGLAGIADQGEKSTGSLFVMVDTATAQRLTARVGAFDVITVAARDGVSQEQLTDSIRGRLPSNTEAITGEAYTQEQRDLVSSALGGLTTAIGAFGYIALFVGAFVIYNTFSIVAALRTRELALVRAVGGSRRQVLVSMLLEALAVGLLSGLAGLTAGWLLALVAKPLVSKLFPVDSIAPLSGSIVAQAMFVAVVVTVLSALIPAIRTTRIPPIAALGEIAVDRSGLSRLRLVFGSLFALAGVGLVAAADAGAFDNGLPPIGIGGGLILVAVVVIGPVFAGPLARVIGAPIAAVFGTTGRLGRDNAERNPKRTIATAVALTIGVALIMVVAVVAASIKGLLDSANEAAYQSIDAIVDPGDFSLAFAPQVKDDLEALPEVDKAASFRLDGITILSGKAAQEKRRADGETKDGVPVGTDEIVGGIDPAEYLSLVDLGGGARDATGLRDGEVLVRQEYLSDNGLRIGDTVEIYAASAFARSGIQKWRIAASFQRQVGPEFMYVNLATFATIARPGNDVDRTIFVTRAEGVDQSTLERAVLEKVTKNNPIASVTDPAEFAAKQTQIFNVFLGVVYGLLFLSIIIAVIGVVNALSLAVFERTREIGLLRAVGMTRGQLQQSVWWESMIIAVLGTFLGLVIGIALAWSMVRGIGDSQIKPVMPWVTIAVVLVLSLFAGVAAALWPAWRASEKDVLEAIATA